MTYLSGDKSLRRGRNRLLHPVNQLLILLEGVLLAATCEMGLRSGPFDPNTGVLCTCRQFPKAVGLPVSGAIKGALENRIPDEILLSFLASRNSPKGEGWIQTQGFQQTLLYAVTPIFVDFYEQNLSWMKANISASSAKWPEPWDFARVVRNASAHGGKLCMHKPASPSVTWHHIEYGPAENGLQVIGGDLDAGDIIVLMFEMSDALDAAGAPI